jgi:hypothetical protein
MNHEHHIRNLQIHCHPIRIPIILIILEMIARPFGIYRGPFSLPRGTARGISPERFLYEKSARTTARLDQMRNDSRRQPCFGTFCQCDQQTRNRVDLVKRGGLSHGAVAKYRGPGLYECESRKYGIFIREQRSGCWYEMSSEDVCG